MKRLVRAGASLCCVGMLLTVSGALAGTPKFVAENARTVPGGRAVEVVLSQAELKSNINSANIVVVNGGLAGALIGAMVESGIEADRAKKAEAAITPLRDQMVDFNADDLAVATTKNGLATIDWLPAGDIKFSKDASPVGKSTFLDAAGTPQTAFFTYSYDLTPDFSSLRVVVSLQFASKTQPEDTTRPEARLSNDYLTYAETITSIVTLPAPGKDINANAQL